MALSEGGWAGRGRKNFLPFGWKTILEETQVGRRHEDVERKREHWDFTSRNKRRSEDDCDGTLEQHYLPKVKFC